MRRFLFCILLLCTPLAAGPFTGFFDSVDRGDLDKMWEILDKMKPKVEPLPYFRTVTRGLVTAMGWHFRQDFSKEIARNKAISEITQTHLSLDDKEELIEIIEYLSEESETLLEKGKNLFKKKKKKEVPIFRIEIVEIYFGALLSQATWVPASNFGTKMISDGVKRLST